MNKKNLRISLLCSIVFVAFIGLYLVFDAFVNQNEVAVNSVSVKEDYKYIKN